MTFKFWKRMKPDATAAEPLNGYRLPTFEDLIPVVAAALGWIWTGQRFELVLPMQPASQPTEPERSDADWFPPSEEATPPPAAANERPNGVPREALIREFGDVGRADELARNFTLGRS